MSDKLAQWEEQRHIGGQPFFSPLDERDFSFARCRSTRGDLHCDLSAGHTGLHYDWRWDQDWTALTPYEARQERYTGSSRHYTPPLLVEARKRIWERVEVAIGGNDAHSGAGCAHEADTAAGCYAHGEAVSPASACEERSCQALSCLPLVDVPVYDPDARGLEADDQRWAEELSYGAHYAVDGQGAAL